MKRTKRKGIVAKVPTLKTLKSWGGLDQDSEKKIQALIGQQKRILIISEKNTVTEKLLHAMVTFSYMKGSDPAVIPPLAHGNIPGLLKGPKWKAYTKLFQAHKQQYFAAIQVGNLPLDIYPTLKKFTKYFDVVIDMRHIPGHRNLVCQIYNKQGTKWNAVYMNNSYFVPFQLNQQAKFKKVA